MPVPQPTPQFPMPQPQGAVGSLPGMGEQLNQLMQPGGMLGGSDGIFGRLQQLDLSGIESSNFRLLPDDVSYEAEVKKVEDTKSAAGDPMMVITLQTTFPVQHKGVTIKDYLPIMKDTLWRAKSFWEACEALDETRSRLIVDSWAHFQGYIVRFNIRHDEYNNEKRNKVNGSYQAGFETPGLAGASEAGAAAPTSAPMAPPAPAGHWQQPA